MTVKIRFSLVGKPGQRSYRIIVVDSRKKRDTNSFCELIGHYNPRTKEMKVKEESLKKWLAYGAQPTPKLQSLIKKYKINQDINS